jgi:hypothetical protein
MTGIIISDMHKAILSSVAKHLPKMFHRKCLYHLILRLKHYMHMSRNSADYTAIISYLTEAVYASSKEYCDNALDILKKKFPKAWEYLKIFNKKDYCSSYIDFPTFDRFILVFLD